MSANRVAQFASMALFVLLVRVRLSHFPLVLTAYRRKGEGERELLKCLRAPRCAEHLVAAVGVRVLVLVLVPVLVPARPFAARLCFSLRLRAPACCASGKRQREASARSVSVQFLTPQPPSALSPCPRLLFASASASAPSALRMARIARASVARLTGPRKRPARGPSLTRSANYVITIAIC